MNNSKTRFSRFIPILAVVILAVACVAVLLILRGRTPEAAPMPDSSASSTTQKQTSEPTSTEEPLTIDNVIPTQDDTTETEPQPDTDEATQTSELTTKQNAETGRIVVDVDRSDWYFIVVNAGREMPEGYVPELKEILGCGKYLDYRVAPHYEDMYYAAKKDGITLTPYSAYRSYERQKNNYNNLTKSYMSQYGLNESDAAKKAATVILPPGTSEHNLGFAMDVCNTLDSFANTKEYAWLQQHAQEYGFILRYTAEKQPITGIVPEPWHWRYVGVENAEKIKNSGLCLEEYLDSIGVAY